MWANMVVLGCVQALWQMATKKVENHAPAAAADLSGRGPIFAAMHAVHPGGSGSRAGAYAAPRRRRRGNVATMPAMMLHWALAATALLGTAIAAAPRPHFVFLLIDGELVCVPL